MMKFKRAVNHPKSMDRSRDDDTLNPVDHIDLEEASAWM